MSMQLESYFTNILDNKPRASLSLQVFSTFIINYGINAGERVYQAESYIMRVKISIREISLRTGLTKGEVEFALKNPPKFSTGEPIYKYINNGYIYIYQLSDLEECIITQETDEYGKLIKCKDLQHYYVEEAREHGIRNAVVLYHIRSMLRTSLRNCTASSLKYNWLFIYGTRESYAKKLGISKKMFGQAIDYLNEHGLIHSLRSGANGRGHHTLADLKQLTVGMPAGSARTRIQNLLVDIKLDGTMPDFVKQKVEHLKKKDPVGYLVGLVTGAESIKAEISNKIVYIDSKLSGVKHKPATPKVEPFDVDKFCAELEDDYINQIAVN